ncbi:MAG: hypothetical protein PHI34_09995 [Acidobacteriota bacterium]|nr:hypothetical protein [Acidobacteriota bacterium]
MTSIKQWKICRILAIVLCLFIAGEAHYILAAQANQPDPLETAFAQGREAYFAAKYEDAKTELEKLVSALDAVAGRDSFKGETFLLMGATYEKLKLKDLAIKYYCKAKIILGEGKSIAGLELKKLKYYGRDCTGAAGSIAGTTTGPKRSFLGKFLGTLLFLSLLGIGVYFLYTKVIKKSSSDSGDTDTTEYVYKSACFHTSWAFDIYSEWSGSVGTVSLEPQVAPQPSENNNWTDSVTYTLSTSGGGTLTLIRLKLSVTMEGGDNGTRHDQAWIDNASILDVTNTFTEACATPGSKDYNDIYQKNEVGSFTLKHSIQLSGANQMKSTMRVTKK